MLTVCHLGFNLFALIFAEGGSAAADHSTVIFFAELVLMLVVGRVLGEIMIRLGQPEVMGQLLAGVLIGPTVLGTIWPGAQHFLFPNTPELKKMIDGISQVGILLLLLLAGMETDFAIVRQRKRAAFFSSLSGILLPFGCGLLLGELLPDYLLPAPDRRWVTGLFLATALSISSIKIVALVIMEVDFMRRNIGQLILATAIIDDTVGWIIVAVISGIAAEGALHLKGVGLALGGTLVFLSLSFTFGRTLITYVIRWTNDTLHLEFSVLSVVLILMFVMAVLTDLIGVHTVLGAFVTGMLVGRSPIMTDHIREQTRGLVLGLFAPIFFAVAGLSVNLTILKDVHKLELAVGLILIASLGKLGGCLIGGKLGGLTNREAIALAVGMNARGTTEVIVATIGLGIGVLTQDIYTLIVVMAVTTTMVMPPMLRWALGRIKLSPEEKERLEREAAEKNDYVPGVKRLLIAAERGDCGHLAALLGGLFLGARKIMATVLDLQPSAGKPPVEPLLKQRIDAWVQHAVDAADLNRQPPKKNASPEELVDQPPSQIVYQVSQQPPAEAIQTELANGYDMIFVGWETASVHEGQDPGAFNASIEKLVRSFAGAVAIAIARGEDKPESLIDSLNILVPTTGTDYSRLAAEVAVALGKAANCQVTVLNVSPPPAEGSYARGRQKHLRPGRAVLEDIKTLGRRENVAVKTIGEVSRTPEPVILKQLRQGQHNLLVLGANARPGRDLFFGHNIQQLLEKVKCSILVVSS